MEQHRSAAGPGLEGELVLALSESEMGLRCHYDCDTHRHTQRDGRREIQYLQILLPILFPYDMHIIVFCTTINTSTLLFVFYIIRILLVYCTLSVLFFESHHGRNLRPCVCWPNKPDSNSERNTDRLTRETDGTHTHTHTVINSMFHRHSILVYSNFNL